MRQSTIENLEIQNFKHQFHGDIFLREDKEYDTVREIWNRLVDRHPSIIARCRGAADVVKAIKFAREHELEVAIKGGGHHVAGHALCNDGLTIDLSPMKWAKQLRKFQKPIADSIRPILYTEFQKSLDSRWDDGFYNDWRSLYLDELTPEFIAILSKYLQQVHSPWTDIKIFHLEGAVNRIPENATAFGNRKARFILVIQARWEKEIETERNLDWCHKLLQALTCLAKSGAYSNFLAEDEPARIPEVYGTNYERLREIKQRYDPENFFHFNTNIKPIGW